MRQKARLLALVLWSLAVWILGVPLVALVQSGDPRCRGMTDQASRDSCTSGTLAAGALIIGTAWLVGLLTILIIFRLTRRSAARQRDL